MQEFGTVFGTNLGAIAVTAVALLLFGSAYNRLVAELTRRGYADGYVWLEVVIGVAVTVIAAGATIGWPAALLMGIYFSASGLPMAVGDIWRHVQARRREAQERRELHE